MSGIFKKYNESTGQWEAILVGTQGPQGATLDVVNNTNNYLLTATGGSTVNGESGLTWDGTQLEITGSIIPAADNIYDLGSQGRTWRDVYVGPGSLYVDGTKVLSSQAAELVITTDAGQSLKILETGADDITLQTETGNIELKGTVEIESGKKITDSAATQVVIGDSLKVEGNIIPDLNEARDLGSSSLRWRDLYLSGNTLHLGDTKFTRTDTGDVEVKDSSGNRKKVIADAIELRRGGKVVKIDIDETSGQLITTANDSTESQVNVPSLEARDSVIQADVDSLETRLVADISTETGRIDAILTGASADTDTFVEVVSLINGVDTANDQAFASYVLRTDASVDSLEGQVTQVGTSGNETTGTVTLAGSGATTVSQTGNTVTINTPTVAGPQGPQGVNGTIGVDGAQGPTGPQGNNGSNGSTGAQGPTGPTGGTGSTGAQGVQGPAGTSGSGTANYLTKWNGTTSQTNSLIYDNGTNVGIGTYSPSAKLEVVGMTKSRGVYNEIPVDGSNETGNAKDVTSVTASSLSSTPYYWKIATLPSSVSSQAEMLTVDYYGGSFVDKMKGSIIFKNREGFVANHYVRHGNNLSGARIQTYTQTDGSVDVYIYIPTIYHILAVNMYTNSWSTGNTATLYTNPTKQATTPTGTLSFDSYTNSSYTSILPNGNVGIGTTSPNVQLHLQDGASEDVSGSTIRMDLSGINPYWEIQARNGVNAANRKLHFYTNSPGSNEVLTLTQAGNVGIGTTAPTTKLEVYGTAESTPSYTTGGIFRVNSAATNALIFGTLSGSPFGGYIQSGGSNKYPLILNPEGGNVGIGTTSPSATLSIKNSSNNNSDNLGQVLTNSEFRLQYRFDGLSSLYIGGLGSERGYLQGVNNAEDAGADISLNPYGGNVGIGTNLPSAKLDVVGNTELNGGLTQSGGDVNFNNNTLFVDEDTGFVGIGTDNPVGVLQISQPSSPLVALQNTSSITSGSRGDFVWYNSNVSSVALIRAEAVTDNVGTLLDFYIRPVGGSLTQAMRLTSNGYLGIGTTSPSTYGGKFVTYSSGGYAGINTDGQIFSYQNLDVATAGGRFVGGSNQGYLGDIGIEQTTTGAKGGYIRFNTASSGTNTPAERMRITSAGYVGIGTTSPTSRLTLAPPSVADQSTIEFTNTDNAVISSFYNLTFAVNNSNTQSGRSINFTTGGKGYGNQESTMMTIQADDGNVGIGTTSPDYKLNIVDNQASDYVGLFIANSRPYGTGQGAYGASLWLGKEESGGGNHPMGSITARPNSEGSSTQGHMTFSTRASGVLNERLRITSDGNVGIGTTNPTAKLHISNTSGDANIVLAGPSQVLSIDQNSIRTTTASQIAIFTNSTLTNGLYINSSGNVGIGTTSPSSKLDVNGVISSRTSTNSAYSVSVLEISSGGTPSQIKITTAIPFVGTTNAHSVTIRGFQFGSANTVDLQISWHVYLNSFYNRTATSSGGWAPTIRLAVENGYVVIHLTSPGYWPKLYVESLYNAFGGTSHAQGWSWADAAISSDANTPNEVVPYKVNFGNNFLMTNTGNVGIGTTSPGAKLHVLGGNTDTVSQIRVGGNATEYVSGIDFYTGTSSRGFVGWRGINSGAPYNAYGMYLLNYDNSPIIFGTATGNEKMRINDNGNVGIGTTSPSSKLDINGGYKWNGVAILTDAAYFRGSATYGFRFNNAADTYNNVIFYDNGNSYFRGNVGIGTTSPTSKLQVNGTILPGENGTQNLGSNTLRWNTVYTSDLSLKNDVGDWTIVEGEDDLFLYNNKRDKVYKFNLTEVDKETAPKKRS